MSWEQELGLIFIATAVFGQLIIRFIDMGGMDRLAEKFVKFVESLKKN